METFKSKRSKNLIKNILVSFMLCLLVTNAIAQESDLLAFNFDFESPKYRVSPPTNRNNDYIAEVFHKGQSDQLSALQQKVTNFDITKLEEYSSEEPSIYNVVFNEKNASIYARYDREGNLVSSTERHVNIKIPPALSRKIAIEFPGWSFEKSIYSVRYNKNSKSVKNLKVLLKKEGQKKTVKMVLDL